MGYTLELAMKSEYIGNGLGKKLLTTAIEEAKKTLTLIRCG